MDVAIGGMVEKTVQQYPPSSFIALENSYIHESGSHALGQSGSGRSF